MRQESLILYRPQRCPHLSYWLDWHARSAQIAAALHISYYIAHDLLIAHVRASIHSCWLSTITLAESMTKPYEVERGNKWGV